MQRIDPWPGEVPAGVHVATLTDVDVTGAKISATVVWADRIHDFCTHCFESLPLVAEECPVFLSRLAPGGQAQPHEVRHGCGAWITPIWRQVHVDEEVSMVAARMAQNLERLRKERGF